MSFRSIVVAALTAVGLSVGVPAGASADVVTTDQAARFIQSLGDDAIKVLQQKDLPMSGREDRFRDLLKDGFAVQLIGKFVLGKFWNQATEQQRQEYLDVFAEWIVKTYAIRFGGYSGEKFTVSSTLINAQDKDVFVSTRIDRPDSRQPILADWRVRGVDGKPRIVDVRVEGVSMLITHRDEFASVATHSGVNGIIGTLKDRIAKLSKSS